MTFQCFPPSERGFRRCWYYTAGFEPQTISVLEIRCYAPTPMHPDITREELLNFD